jgi:hypothetical protein
MIKTPHFRLFLLADGVNNKKSRLEKAGFQNMSLSSGNPAILIKLKTRGFPSHSREWFGFFR